MILIAYKPSKHAPPTPAPLPPASTGAADAGGLDLAARAGSEATWLAERAVVPIADRGRRDRRQWRDATRFVEKSARRGGRVAKGDVSTPGKDKPGRRWAREGGRL